MKVQNYIELLVKAVPERRRILARGKPGVGKTQGAEQACQRMNRELIVSPLALDDPATIRGYPIRDNGHAAHCLFGTIHRVFNATKPTLWLLDDIGQATESTLKSVMRILQSGELDGRKLPDCVSIIGCTNDISHGAGVYGMIEPLKDRWHTIIEVESDLDQTIAYGLSSGWDSSVLAFLRNAPDALNDWKPEKSMKTGGSTPRGWEDVSDWLKIGVDDREVVCGKVGEGRGTAFLAFRELMSELPDINQVLLNPEDSPVPTNPSARFLVSMAIACRMTAGNFGQCQKYLARLPAMMRAFSVRDALQAESISRKASRLPKDHKPISSSRDFTSWAVSKDGKDIIAAVS